MKKNALTGLPGIRARFTHGAIILLDFDGTLAPIVPTPATARMSGEMRKLLARCARRHQTGIISGRLVSDVKKRIGIPSLAYSGIHGLEWEIAGVRGRASVPARMRRAIRDIRTMLQKEAAHYRGALIEDKRLTLACHYRRVARADVRQFKRAVYRIARDAEDRGDVRVLLGKEVIEILPNIHYDKGEAVQFLAKRLARTGKESVLYIGDDATDEHAFRVLKRGVTIHIGTRKRTAARYCIRRQKDVAVFLEKLTSDLKLKGK